MKKSSPLLAIIYFALVLSAIVLVVISVKNITFNKKNNPVKEKTISNNKIENLQAEVNLVIDESYINNILQSSLGTEAENIKAKITPESIVVTANVKRLAGQKATITESISVTDGQLKLKTDGVKISFIGVPGALTKEIDKKAQEAVDKNINSKFYINSLKQEEGKITLTGFNK